MRFTGAALLCACASLSACGGRTEHEKLGDRRYAERAWSDALAEYRLAARQRRPSLELRSKRAAAALRAGALAEAVTAYRELAEAEPSARTEAAEGLARVARAAIELRDVAATRGALEALLELSPSRLGGLGPGVALALDPERGDTALLLAAAAAQPGPALDSLVGRWAELVAREGRCDEAARAWEGVLRRAPGAAVQLQARSGLANCRVDAGRLALSAGQLEDAEALLREAVLLGVSDSTIRLAWVLIGDVRWANGDTLTAVDAYRRASAGGDVENPIVARALEQLKKLEGREP